MRPEHTFLSQPIRSLQTMLRVIAEDDPSHQKIVPDGIYGPETVSAVTRFQQMHGLATTGVTDQITWDAVVSHYEPAFIRRGPAWPLEILLEPGQVLQKGTAHPYVLLVQAMLKPLSEVYSSIGDPGLSGVLDEATADALAAFQLLNNLPATGQLDKVTWKHLALHYPLAVTMGTGTAARNLLPNY